MSTKNEKGEIQFDDEEQKMVDRIVQDRLARVKREDPADYSDLKALDRELEELYPGMSAAQRAARIREQKEQRSQLKAQREAAARAERNGTTPEQEMELQRLREKQETIEAKLQAREKEEQDRKLTEEERTKNEEMKARHLKEFTEAYPDIDLKTLNEDEKFIRFLKGKRLGEDYSLKDAFDDYKEIVGEAETKGFIDARRKERGSTGGGDGNKGGTYGLTPRQIELAKENGIPLAQYAEDLKKIR